MVSQCMRFTRMSAFITTAFAVFFLVWGHNVCVSHACRHLLRRLLRFPSFRVTMYAFHTYVCIYLDGFCVFLLGMVSQCMRFTRLFASITTSFAFPFLWGHNACVSHACRHLLRRISRFPWYCVTLHAFHTIVGIN